MQRWTKNRLTLVVTALLVPYSLFSSISLFKLSHPVQNIALDLVLLVTNNNTSLTNPSSERPLATSSDANSTKNDSTTQPKYVIFYNIFIDPNNVTLGVEIVREQTIQIFKKLSAQKRTSQVPLYYNIIGYNYSGQLCPPALNCTFRDYFESAFEEVTLQHLYDHCVRHPDDYVYYLHNKGSFSQNYYNEKKRRMLTNNLFHRGHKLLSQEARSCNVASIGWEPLPHWHNRGNFWLAQCSYVRNLIPPKDFGRARSTMIQRLLQQATNRSSWKCLRSYFNESIDNIEHQSDEVQTNVGTGRYNNEIWVSSHPDVIPCDVAETAFTSSISSKYLFPQSFAQHEWFRMYGRLFEFYQLYRKVPSNSSFFWEYYAAAKDPTTPGVCQTGWNRTSYFDTL